MSMKIPSWLRRILNLEEPAIYEYGVLYGGRARRVVRTGEVQFVLWKAGEQGHLVDFFCRADQSHWPNFEPDPICNQPQHNNHE